MRPGLLCPGRAPMRRPIPPPPWRFNEAGAVMPRKGPKLIDHLPPGAPLQ